MPLRIQQVEECGRNIGEATAPNLAFSADLQDIHREPANVRISKSVQRTQEQRHLCKQNHC